MLEAEGVEKVKDTVELRHWLGCIKRGVGPVKGIEALSSFSFFAKC